MAMSDTGSSFAAQWAELYHHDLSPGLPITDDTTTLTADSPDIFTSTTVATTAAAASPPTSGGSTGGSPTKAAAALGVDGARVGKPARRRSRASRRAPVTLLNTDTANFRAMVQQFTGIPTPPAGAFGGPVINFAGDYGGGFPSSGVMSFDHLHRSHPPPASLHDQLRRQQQYTGGNFGGGYNGGGSLLHGGAGDVFASHGLSSAEDRMLLQSIQQAAHHMPPASTANGFFA
ncbi:hypothetical protein HU200_042963 [Digitaria exilis]|uniref:VQ domain-containing protein n=1 Tax=Digitaria exilis TaxID=1010633 RepID=A0A835B509_9POAL|nr:hypothetical protein HU200_042963 [Digitaria exilis]